MILDGLYMVHDKKSNRLLMYSDDIMIILTLIYGGRV